MTKKIDEANVFELYLSGMSIHEVNGATGISLSTIRYRLKRKGILRSLTDAIRLAGKRGRLGSGMRGKKRVFTEQHKERIRQGKLVYGAKHAVGYTKKPSGYIEITRGINKGKRQHIVIMEEHIGRSLVHGECVHHENGIRDDNRLCNLRLMTRSEHTRLHALTWNMKRDKKGRFINGRRK